MNNFRCANYPITWLPDSSPVSVPVQTQGDPHYHRNQDEEDGETPRTPRLDRWSTLDGPFTVDAVLSIGHLDGYRVRLGCEVTKSYGCPVLVIGSYLDPRARPSMGQLVSVEVDDFDAYLLDGTFLGKVGFLRSLA